MTTQTIQLTTGLYAPPRTPVMVDVPALTYLELDGVGPPWTTSAWAQAVDTLHAVASAIAQALGAAPGTTMPVEARFPAPTTDSPNSDPRPGNLLDGDRRAWTLLLALPDLASAPVVERAVATLTRVTQLEGIREVRRARMHEGWAVQVLEVGAGADRRRAALDLLDAFARRHGYRRHGERHEIYLDDPLTTSDEHTRTILRQPVWPVG